MTTTLHTRPNDAATQHNVSCVANSGRERAKLIRRNPDAKPVTVCIEVGKNVVVDAPFAQLVANATLHLYAGHVYYSPIVEGVGSQQTTRLDRLIAAACGLNTLGREVVHKNGDRLDLRLCNLTVCESETRAVPQVVKDHYYLGVTQSQSRGHWVAAITHEGVTKCLGWYPTAIEAAVVYDAKAVEIWGLSAKLNFPAPSTQS